MDKRIDFGFLVGFTVLVLVALVAGACGATHQFAMAGICAIMAIAAAIDLRRDN